MTTLGKRPAPHSQPLATASSLATARNRNREAGPRGVRAAAAAGGGRTLGGGRQRAPGAAPRGAGRAPGGEARSDVEVLLPHRRTEHSPVSCAILFVLFCFSLRFLCNKVNMFGCFLHELTVFLQQGEHCFGQKTWRRIQALV